jgi:glycosyltransferase involved in cell wall biosynthesis
MNVSVIIPIYNEQGSLEKLIKKIIDCVGEKLIEIICVDDGSSDDTPFVLAKLHTDFPLLVKIITLRKNSGKSIALNAGFDQAKGDILVMIDADLQDHPEDILKVIAPIENNEVDVVSGWRRKRRHDLIYVVFSKFFNFLIRTTTSLNVHDLNCGLKAFRKESLSDIKLYGHMHRFILMFVANLGYRIGEVAIQNSARNHGVSKYTYSKFYHGIVDLLSAFFITRYLQSPLHIFGVIGMAMITIGLAIGVYFTGDYIYCLITAPGSWSLVEHPLWVITPITVTMGTILILFGLLGELIVYCIRQITEFPNLVVPAQDKPSKNN